MHGLPVFASVACPASLSNGLQFRTVYDNMTRKEKNQNKNPSPRSAPGGRGCGWYTTCVNKISEVGGHTSSFQNQTHQIPRKSVNVSGKERFNECVQYFKIVFPDRKVVPVSEKDERERQKWRFPRLSRTLRLWESIHVSPAPRRNSATPAPIQLNSYHHVLTARSPETHRGEDCNHYFIVALYVF